MIKKTGARIVLIGLTIASLAACNDSNTETASKQSQPLTVYTALENEQVSQYLSAFEKRYPDIKVNIIRESTGTLTAKLIAESKNPQADLVWGTSASSLLVLENMGALKAYAPEGIERINDKFRSKKEVPTWVGIDAYETAFIVNTVEAKKLGLPKVESYKDLLNPAFKNHIIMSNPNSSGTGFLSVSGILQTMGDKDGWTYLENLHKNIKNYTHSGSKPAKMAAAGETVVGISYGYAGISQVAKGAPVKVIFPKEGSGWDAEANALIKKDKINPAAYTFLDWAISDEAMDMYKQYYPIITLKTVKNFQGYEKDPISQLIDNDLEWAAQERKGILEAWLGRFDGKSEAKK